MKVVIIGGTGLIGRKLAPRLRAMEHQVVIASPSTGVDAVSGKGLDVLSGADVIVDVTNSPAFADDAVMEFFTRSTRNVIAAAEHAGVRHMVILSVVGADQIKDSGYMRAKAAQEALVRAGGIPFTIVRATQFFEFLAAIGEASMSDGRARVPPARMQPMAADDVAALLSDVVTAPPVDGVVEIGGPDALPMAELVRRRFAASGDTRPIEAVSDARYFGARLEDRSLLPGAHARQGQIRLDQWLETMITARK